MYNTWKEVRKVAISAHCTQAEGSQRHYLKVSTENPPTLHCHTLISLLFWYQNKPGASLRGLNPGKETHAPVLSDSLLPLSVMLILPFGVGPRRTENEDPGQWSPVWPVFALPTLLCWPCSPPPSLSQSPLQSSPHLRPILKL